MSRRLTRMHAEQVGTSSISSIRFTGADRIAHAGTKLTVWVELTELDADTRYGFARTIADWAHRVEAAALDEIHRDAQMVLFEAHTQELNRFAPPD